MTVATNITCSACNSSFSFTAEEQEFYDTKGFAPPKKCKPCRDIAKQNRNGGSYSSSEGSSHPRPIRTLYDAVCASCGVDTKVPFMPSEHRPVYCRDCFQNRTAS